MEQGPDGISLEQNTRNALALNDAHRGGRIVIVGAGPQLAHLGAQERSWLADQTTIGVNRTQYVIPLTYFMSAYPGEVMLALHRSDDVIALHIRAQYMAPLFLQTVSLVRLVVTDDTVLPRHLTPPVPAIYTLNNVALAATHLALVMGAAEIVYVGVEQRNKLHFYDTDEALREEMRHDLTSVGMPELWSLDHPYTTLEVMLEALQRDPEVLAATPFYKWNHAPTFRFYMGQPIASGVRFVSTATDSVVTDAGARVATISELMAADRNGS